MNSSNIVDPAVTGTGSGIPQAMSKCVRQLLDLKERSEQNFAQVAMLIASREEFANLHGFSSEDFVKDKDNDWEIVIPLLAGSIPLVVDKSTDNELEACSTAIKALVHERPERAARRVRWRRA